MQDTGCGIPAAQLSAVFDAFEQVKNSGTRNFSGTGLGLAISRQLINLMGGQITATSIVDQGSEFTITLPARVPPVTTGTTGPLNGKTFSLDLSDPRLALEAAFRCRRLGMVMVAPQEKADLVLCESESKPTESAVLICSNTGREVSQYEANAASVDFPVAQTTLERIISELLLVPADEGEIAGEVTPALRDFAGLRILLADDNATNRLVVRKMLEPHDVDLTEAENGQVAADRVQTTGFDLVLMDMSMPIMNGEEATRTIRAFETSTGRAQVPILALTANASDRDRELCLKAGMNGFLSKPVRKTALIEVLARWSPAPDLL